MKKREMIEVPIGDVIERFGKKFKCVKSNLSTGKECANCAFKYIQKVCETVKCTKSRLDKESMIFKEIKK